MQPGCLTADQLIENWLQRPDRFYINWSSKGLHKEGSDFKIFWPWCKNEPVQCITDLLLQIYQTNDWCGLQRISSPQQNCKTNPKHLWHKNSKEIQNSNEIQIQIPGSFFPH